MSQLPTFVDSSMLSTFKDCPRKFYWQYVCGYRAVEKSIHLIAGGAFARGVEVVRKAVFEGKVEANEAILQGQLAAFLFWMKESPNEFYLEDAKSLPNILLAIEEYFHHFGTTTDHMQPYVHEGKPAVEFSFALPMDYAHPVTNDPLLYVGRFDMLAIYNGALFVNDEKTTKSLGPQWAKKWDLRSQFTGYCWAAKQYGHPVVGAIVRGVGLLKSETKFSEVITYRADWQIDEWLHTTHRTIEDMLIASDRGEWIKILDTPCEMCSYKVLCDKRDPEPWISTYFTVSHWNPLTKE